MIDTGTIIWYGGEHDDVPTNFLLCDGSAVSRTTYATLFTAISTLHGIGDGSTTFNLPNLIDRFAQGVATNTTDSGATGGSTSATTSSTGGPSNGGDQNSNRRDLPPHTHSVTDVRPPYIELTPIIAI